MINLFYLSGNTTGGWVTFTYHLIKTLEAVGQEAVLWKIGNRSEAFERDFGYGLKYKNVSLEDACQFKLGPSVIVAVQKNYREAAAALIAAGARVVLHDPTELKAGLAGVEISAPWVIRRAVQRQVPGSVFIRHPYVRHGPAPAGKRKGAVSTSRIDFDKHTELLLDANRLGAGIDIRGFENRLYTKFKIMPNYPEWEQSVAAYDRHDPAAAFKLLCGYKCMVDMSLIKGDGGGTQYTFLEAWDAGTVPLIHSGWIMSKEDMVPDENCFSVADAAQLKRYCKSAMDMQPQVDAGYKSLKRHAPKLIGKQIMEWLDV